MQTPSESGFDLGTSLILIYVGTEASIKSQYKGRAVRKNVYVVADKEGWLSSFLNAGFPYRHVKGSFSSGTFTATILQKNGQSETELEK